MNKEDLELGIYEKKKDCQSSSIIGILLSIAIIVSWYMLITNIDFVWETIQVFMFPVLLVTGVLTVVGSVLILLMLADAYDYYIKYNKLKIQLKYLSEKEMNK